MTCIGYVIAVARICPYIRWRYVSNLYPLLILVFVSAISKLVKTKRSQLFAYGIYGLGMVQLLITKGHYMAPLHEGVSILQQSQIEASVGSIDSVYLYDNDSMRLYYNAYLWPSNTKVYVTRPEQFFERAGFTDVQRVCETGEGNYWVYLCSK